MKYKVVPEWNDEQSYDIEIVDSRVLRTDGTFVSLTKFEGHQNLFMITSGDKKVPAVIRVSSDGTVECTLQGYRYTVQVSDETTGRYASALKASAHAGQQQTRVTAPMPGLLRQVFIVEGQQVRKGESLFILEAMKMENMIKSSVSGIVRKLSAASGSAVEKGNLLCFIESVAR